MSTLNYISTKDITKINPIFSEFQTIIESAFYSNNVHPVQTVSEAYRLAEEAPGTIVTDLLVYQPTKLGIPEDGKVLVDNSGKVVGRTASARKIIGQPGIEAEKLAAILREAVYKSTFYRFYSCQVFVGLGKKFMTRSHLMLPEGFENNLYSYVLNFQIVNSEYETLYQTSESYPEKDIFIFADPYWTHPEYPNGLAIFDPTHNVAAILGLRYFGELKKGTLTLAWAMAHRQNFVACHGGMKQYQLPNATTYTMAAFGLSGSGKSTITLAKHGGKYPVTVLHDDAFVISQKDGSTTALEPAYFDKTQDYPMSSEEINYFLTCQNVGVTLDQDKRKVLVTEDIRNGNGRTVKSRFTTPNRIDHIDEKIDAIYWIMKDDSLPPVVRVEDPILAAVFGVTLATKRSTAENIAPDVDLESLVIEPFANPFRVYPLKEDYDSFKQIFEMQQTACYILNTGFFNEKKIQPHHTLHSIEAIVANTARFKAMGPLTAMSYLPIEGYIPDFTNQRYIQKVKKRLEIRLAFIQECKEKNQGYNALSEETALMMQHLILELEAYEKKSNI